MASEWETKSANQTVLIGAFDLLDYEQYCVNSGAVAVDDDRVAVLDYLVAGGLVGHKFEPMLTQEGLYALAGLVLGIEFGEFLRCLVVAGVGDDACFAG